METKRRSLATTKKYPTSLKAQNNWLRLIRVSFLLTWAPIVVFLLFNMLALNVKIFLGTVLVIFGAHISYTGLLFNRARAYENGPLRRRTLVAAEIAFRATLLFMTTAVIGISWFSFLLISGYSETVPDWHAKHLGAVSEIKFWPFLVTTVVVVLFQSSYVFLHSSLVVLVKRNIGISAMIDVYRQYRK